MDSRVVLEKAVFFPVCVSGCALIDSMTALANFSDCEELKHPSSEIYYLLRKRSSKDFCGLTGFLIFTFLVGEGESVG